MAPLATARARDDAVNAAAEEELGGTDVIEERSRWICEDIVGWTHEAEASCRKAGQAW